MENFKIEKLDHQGRGITYINSKITFVENALPDEIVELEIVRENKKYNEAVVKRYVQISDKRIKSACPFYEQCGGCDLLHINYSDQLNYKENKIKEIISKYSGQSETVINDIVPSPKQFNYRNKITLKVNKKIGFYKKRSYEIVEIDNCLLANNKINESLKFIRNLSLPQEIIEIVIRSINEESISLTITLQKNINIELLCSDLIKNFDSVTFLVDEKVIKYYGKSNIIGRLNNFDFQMSPTAFFQVNTLQTINLYEKVSEYVEKMNYPTVLDLYCGTGTIGIYIGKYAKKIIGVEINESAIQNAKENAKINNISQSVFYSGDAKKFLKKNKVDVDLVIVDPPRSGLDEEVTNDIMNVIRPKNIIYVSCDPVTLSRDLMRLKEFYIVNEITPFDMFPNTSHVECLTTLVKKK